MGLFDYGLGVFLETYNYYFQFTLIYATILPVLIVVAHILSMISINNQKVKTDYGVSVLEDKSVKKSKK